MTRKLLNGALAFFVLLLLPLSATAHPLAPGLLSLEETDSNRFDVSWKIPLKLAGGVRPEPVLPAVCNMTGPASEQVIGTGRVTRWALQCSEPLVGHTIKIDQLVAAGSGILLKLQFQNGQYFHHMLSADDAAFTIPAAKSVSQIAWNYLVLGIEHLITGIDHVLFVITLFLLIGWTKKLVWTVTLFTVGHSVTLALTVLGYVEFPVRLVESLIALSIVITAAEWLRGNTQGFFYRNSWLICLFFGLLHGMGFAGALSEIGLPAGEVPLALATFNIGIEVGQLAVIAACGAITAVALRIRTHWPRWVKIVPGYAIGGIAAFWFWQRLGLF